MIIDCKTLKTEYTVRLSAICGGPFFYYIALLAQTRSNPNDTEMDSAMLRLLQISGAELTALKPHLICGKTGCCVIGIGVFR